MNQTNHYDVLFVDNDSENIEKLQTIAMENNLSYLSAKDGHQASEYLDHYQFRLVFLDQDIPNFSGLALLEWIKTIPSSPEVVILSAKAKVESAVKALKMGAFDYLLKPLDNKNRIEFCIGRALEKFKAEKRLAEFNSDNQTDSFENIVGKSTKMRAVFDTIRSVAKTNSNVLITGESGTGKELVAKAIHLSGDRSSKAFIALNCAAIPDSLLESELFGYLRGSFTGAHSDKRGYFEAAHTGTIFLDEIGEIPLNLQVKLLRVLQEGEIQRIGENLPRKVDVRLIAATNQNLIQMVKKKEFREDLFYRLNVISILMPPLRERIEDIPILAYHFLNKFSKKTGKDIRKISLDAIEALNNYRWQGNVRELENIIERAVVLSETDTIQAKNLPSRILSTTFYNVPVNDNDFSQYNYQEAKKRALNIFNRSYIIGLLEKTGGNITAASEKAGMDRSNFRKIMKKYHVEISPKR